MRARAGDESEESITNALVELAAELEGEHGFPIGASEPNTAGANGDEWLLQRGGGGGGPPGRRGGARPALAAELASELGDEEEFNEHGEPGEESVDEDLPPEIREVEREAYALHYKAKQRMAEVKKMRQYYRKGDQVEERKKALAEKIKNTACHNCGEVGHWSRECPHRKAQQVMMAAHTTPRRSTRQRKASSSTGLASLPEEPPGDHEWDLLVSLCGIGESPGCSTPAGAYMTLPCGVGAFGRSSDHEVLWCVQELATAVILDIGCLKSVAGTTWINQLLRTWRQHNRWFKVHKEKEVFRFGSGDTLTSQYGVELEATFAGKAVILGFSVVKGECPPLLSRHACTQLGVTFDCEHHVLTSKKLGVKNYGLRQTSSGHYVMDIGEFGEDRPDIPSDFKLQAGQEACRLSGINSVLHGELFGSPEVCDLDPSRRAHVHRPLLPTMRRGRTPSPPVPAHRLRRGPAGAPTSGDGVGSPESPQLGRTSGEGIEQCLNDELSSSGAIKSQEGTQGKDSAGIRPARGVPSRPGRRGGAHCDRSDASRTGQDSQGSGQSSEDPREAGTIEGPDRSTGGVPHSVAQLQRGGSLQHDWMLPESDGDLHVEEVGVAGPCEGRGREDHARVPLEEESQVVGDADGEGSGLLVGTFRRLEAKDARPSGASIDVSSEPSPDWGGGSQTGGAGSPVLEDDDVLVETEGGLVAENDTEDYDAVGSDVREELYAMEDLYVDEGDWEGIYKEDKDAYFLDRRRPGAWEKGRPARGVTQKLKKGVQQGIRLMERLKRGAQVGEKFMVLEVFSGSSMLTLVAAESDGWGAYQPVDVILSDDGDMSKKANRDKVKSMVRVMKPDLVVITPPCGPWCAWQRTCRDWDALDETRKEHLPFWRMTREIWDIQTRGGRLCLTEQPEGSEALETEYMSTRDSLYRVTVDQCMFGLNDPASHKLYRKATNLDVNDQAFAVGLAGAPRCNHSPLDHEQIRGRMQVGGKWESRSAIAARWTRSFAKYILKAAQICLAGRPLRVDDDPLPVDRSPSPGRGGWPVYPIEVEEGVLSPEEVLKRQMKQMGAEGERYDYVVFEGDARMLPRRTRATLAHLHVVLGHLSNERLHRMVSLAGGNADLLCGVRNMRCQICSMVRPPGSKPQVSYLKPTNFNQRVSGDVVFVWDVKNVKYAIVHYIDELTDYHVGALEFDPTSEWAAEVLCRLWYDVFGPPDVLITDGGTEFQGSLGRLNDLFAVQHEVVPDQAKWRLGHAERHGAVVKVMMMKVVTELQIDNLRDMQCALSSCFAAKNRIIGQSGVAPLQAVTGRSNPLPGSLLAQITSGKVKFKANEDLILDEALRRGERIRAAAIESCHWLDAHEGLRRALASRSRPPALELIREGATVYVYDPPANRRGLARRLQDNISWSGPAVVVCVERDGTTPKKVWVRVRTRVKAYPLEKIRLATADEMLSADFIVGALKDVEGELAGGKVEVLDYIEKKDDPSGEVEGEDAKARGTPPPLRLDPEAERKREIKHDVPEALRAGQEEEPHLMPFKKKQKLFEQLAKDLGAPTAMQEAAVRERLESAYGQLKKVRKEWKKESKEKSRQASRAGGASASARGSSVPPGKDSLMVEPMVPSEWMALWSEVETHALLWETESDDHPYLKKIIDMAEGYAAGEMKAVLEAELVTGKLGVEYQWRNLDENWRRAYEEPLIKAVQVYFDHDAIAGVAKDAIVDPRKVLTSRFVLTNKGGETLAEAELKTRWILGGHRDVDAGRYPTMAPTASLLGHNILNMVAVQKRWVVHYEDVSAAFL